MNTLRASRQNEYRKIKTRRQKYFAARRAARRVRLPHNSKAGGLLARLAVVRRALTAAVRKRSSKPLPLLSNLQTYEEHLARRVKVDALLQQKRAPIPTTTGAVSRLTFKRADARSPVLRRAAAATHAQSVRHMLGAERVLGAWSPVYPLKWRR